MDKMSGNKRNKNLKIHTSDWLQYLEHISSKNISNYFTIITVWFATLAILISGLSIIISRFSDNNEILFWLLLYIIIILVILIAFFIWFIKYSPSVKKCKKADRFIREILIEQNSKTVEDIKEWIKDMSE